MFCDLFGTEGGCQLQNDRAERFPHAVEIRAALLDLADADKRLGWVDRI